MSIVRIFSPLIVVLCICFTTHAVAQVNLDFHRHKETRQQYIQQQTDAVVKELAGQHPLRMEDFQQAWVKPPYRQLEHWQRDKGTTLLTARFTFDSIGRLVKRESFWSNDSSTDHIQYSDSIIIVHSSGSWRNANDHFTYYYFNTNNTLHYFKQFGSSPSTDTLYSYYHYNSQGYLDTIYRDVDTLYFKYDVTTSREDINYRIKMDRAQKRSPKMLPPFVDKSSVMIAVQGDIKPKPIEADMQYQLHRRAENSSAHIITGKYVVYGSAAIYYIRNSPVYLSYRGPLFVPSPPLSASYQFRRWRTCFGWINYNNYKKRLSFDTHTRKKVVQRTWHGTYIYKRSR